MPKCVQLLHQNSATITVRVIFIGSNKMPRIARKKSASGIYHVMLRGVNKQVIFHDVEDCKRFLDALRRYKPVSGYEIYAYCLMPNHIHLLIREGEESIGQALKRISSSYVYWYNKKYERVGHLFQNRFKSEAVEDEAYFITVLRYIIQNPTKAGIEKAPGTYPWSSYLSYAGNEDHLTDTGFALEMFNSRSDLIGFVCRRNEDKVLDIDVGEGRQGVTDDEAEKIFEEATGKVREREFLLLDKAAKVEYIKVLKSRNLTFDQISKLTGIPKTSVRRAYNS